MRPSRISIQVVRGPIRPCGITARVCARSWILLGGYNEAKQPSKELVVPAVPLLAKSLFYDRSGGSMATSKVAPASRFSGRSGIDLN